MNTGFRSLHPLPCFLYFAGVMLLSMLLLHPLFLSTSLLLLIGLGFIYDTRARMVRTIVAAVVAGLVLLVVNPLFSHRGEHILFYMGEQPITLEAVMYGAIVSLSTVSLLLVFVSYQRVITSDKFLYLFSFLWPKGTLVTMMAMRFVPLLRRRLHSITQVQRTKGVSVLHGSMRKRARDGMLLLQVLLTWSLEEALQTADSMKARGYGLGPRSAYTRYCMRGRDLTAVCWVVLSGAICAAGRIYGYGHLTIYPTLEPVGLSAVEWLDYGLFVLFLGTPVWFEGKEWLRWHYWK
ncbi:energy-coupling factor transporter transmembrane component T [Paenibacillus allorhizosphaerae]|uniref:Energy-coupling factor transporter transmembrane protein EcfT n=1 Tax=Paenibacillus allorhizosphaerae TaxID=2849866 RepID=A0ABM8VRV6_9BACL|nr:energy-coupling factor transporter transmembrane component T [Paenibacillus allorhizosphaerae]CAG7655802.1 Energy-coupling factor transporter transmembrane protein EcfT [Paenibacillus allorhizosphaerae]